MTEGETAAAMTIAFWKSRRTQMLRYLLRRGFSANGAEKCIKSFIDTMAFVAEETGRPQIGSKS